MKPMKYYLSLVCCWLAYGTMAQSEVLNQYVQEGLQNSQTLKQQRFQLQKAIWALDEAKSLFKPAVNFNTTVSSALGGRTIDIPVGDLVNPVYATLNRLTNSNAFPQISNVSEQLIPKDFYDMRFKTSMPLINAELKYNQSIKKELIGLQQSETNVYKRELVKDIKMAYFNYLKATEALSIYENALRLLRESERVNQALIQNGMANPTVSVRTKNEIASIESEVEAAKGTQKNAAAYFNFLLNREFTQEIKVDSSFKNVVIPTKIDLAHREEIDKLETNLSINKQILKLSQSYNQPKIGASLDLGSQGRFAQIASADKNFISPNAFFLVGVSIDLPVYSSGRNQLKVKQAEMDVATADTQLQQVKNQLDLQNTMAQNALTAAKEIHQSKANQISSAQRYYRDMMRRYKEGNLSFIELLDAQTQLTRTQLQQVIAQYDVWLKWVEVERSAAAFDLK